MCKLTNSAISNPFATLIPNQNMMLKQEIKKSFLIVKQTPLRIHSWHPKNSQVT